MPQSPNDQSNPAGAIPVYLAPAPGTASQNLTSAATTELKDGSGYVTSISINTGDPGSTLKLYDGDPGDGGVLLGTWATENQNSISLGLPFSDSLWAVTDGTADLTVSFV